jgi:hypothetical protein
MSDEAKGKQVAPKQGTRMSPGKEDDALKPPKDDTLKITTPR